MLTLKSLTLLAVAAAQHRAMPPQNPNGPPMRAMPPTFMKYQGMDDFVSDKYPPRSNHTCTSAIERLKKGPADFE